MEGRPGGEAAPSVVGGPQLRGSRVHGPDTVAEVVRVAVPQEGRGVLRLGARVEGLGGLATLPGFPILAGRRFKGAGVGLRGSVGQRMQVMAQLGIEHELPELGVIHEAEVQNRTLR